VTESDDRWPIVQILDGKDARWCPSCGYSLRSCIQHEMNSDPQGERCCDECDHPPWERSQRPLFDHPVETEPDLGAGWGPGDLHLTTDPKDPINHPLPDGAELWLQNLFERMFADAVDNRIPESDR
jgi:hypothetical protein